MILLATVFWSLTRSQCPKGRPRVKPTEPAGTCPIEPTEPAGTCLIEPIEQKERKFVEMGEIVCEICTKIRGLEYPYPECQECTFLEPKKKEKEEPPPI